MCQYNRRKHERLSLRFDLECQRVGNREDETQTGRTLNISTGGVLFEISDCGLQREDLVNLEVSIPASEHFFDFGTSLKTQARVLRVVDIKNNKSNLRVAAQFLYSPKFCV
jgi:hypothetical protein